MCSVCGETKIDHRGRFAKVRPVASFTALIAIEIDREITSWVFAALMFWSIGYSGWNDEEFSRY